MQLVLVAGLLGAALAQAKAAAQTSESAEIVPLLECVARNDDRSLTAKFGWDNRSGRTLRPLAGIENKIIPAVHQKLLQTEFAPGRVTTRNGGFTVTFGEDEKVTWLLFDQSVEASAASRPCPPEQRGAPVTTAAARATTTTAKGAAAAGRSDQGGRPGAPRPGSTAAAVAAAPTGVEEAASLGPVDVVPALVLGLVVLGMVAFGLESAGRRLRS